MSLRSREVACPDGPANPWDYKILRPNEDDVRQSLLDDGVAADQEWTRVAKWGVELAGFYRMSRIATEIFELKELTVGRGHRGHGLGGWLLAHAQAVVESSGGRRLVFRSVPCTSIFARSHFREQPDGTLRFDTTPE